jgi:hypothetical protein
VLRGVVVDDGLEVGVAVAVADLVAVGVEDETAEPDGEKLTVADETVAARELAACVTDSEVSCAPADGDVGFVELHAATAASTRHEQAASLRRMCITMPD